MPAPRAKDPGKGDVIATNSNGSKVLRYGFQSPVRGMDGTVTDCAFYAGLSVDVVKDLPTGGELVERLWRECEAAHRSSK